MLIEALDYAGVATFAASSALVSRRCGADLVATVLLALVAAIGGGTLRDLLIARPVSWIVDPRYVGSCVAASALVWRARMSISWPRSRPPQCTDCWLQSGFAFSWCVALGVGCGVGLRLLALKFDLKMPAPDVEA